MLLFCPCEHVEGVVDLPERAKQPGLGDDGGRSRRAGPPTGVRISYVPRRAPAVRVNGQTS